MHKRDVERGSSPSGDGICMQTHHASCLNTTKETYNKRDLPKRQRKTHLPFERKTHKRDLQKRPTKEIYKRNMQKRPIQETYPRDLERDTSLFGDGIFVYMQCTPPCIIFMHVCSCTSSLCACQCRSICACQNRRYTYMYIYTYMIMTVNCKM